MDETAEIRIRIRFSKNLDKSIKEAIDGGEVTSKEDVINRLVNVYKKTIDGSKDFMKPLKALDKHVRVTVESVMIGE